MQSLDLGGHELWLTYIENVHLIPLVLDADRFQNALTSATQIYLHTRGRLTTDGNKWNIELKDLQISFITETIQRIGLDGQVVQDAPNLLPFLHPRAHKTPVNADAPLLLVKLSISPKATAVGVTWHHVLGLLYYSATMECLLMTVQVTRLLFFDSCISFRSHTRVLPLHFHCRLLEVRISRLHRPLSSNHLAHSCLISSTLIVSLRLGPNMPPAINPLCTCTKPSVALDLSMFRQNCNFNLQSKFLCKTLLQLILYRY